MFEGKTIGPFQIGAEIGAGAMGSVHRAVDTRTGQTVAIKFMAPGLGENERVFARFEREAEMLKQLKHPNVVRRFATGKFQKTPFIVMEFVDGENVADLLERRERLTWEEVILIGKQVCSALQHAHENGIIHRDLKPSNLMIMRDGTVKLTDFGIAKDMDAEGLTSAHCTVGTAAYMSPEQCRGVRNLTPKSDLYSAGVMFYELLAGRKPFQAESVMEMFTKHVSEQPERISRLVMDVPPWLDTLVDQMMAKDPAQRPLNAAMVAQALEDVQSKIEAREMAGGPPRKSKKRDREIAEALTRGRKRKRGKKRIDGQKLATGIGLGIALLALAALIAFVLWPEKPEARLQRRFDEGVKLVEEADRLVDAGDEGAAKERWYDARNRLEGIAESPSSPLAAKAKECLTHLEAGRLFLLGNKHLSSAAEGWKAAKANGFDELLDKYPPDDSYVARARKLLEPHEAPALLREARRLLEPSLTPKDRETAAAALAMLLRRYPASAAVAEARLIVAEQEARELVRKKRAGETLPGVINRARDLAIEAIAFEEDGALEDAAARWEEITRLAGDNEAYAPWIALAEDRLARQRK